MTRETVLQAFVTLERAGLRAPYASAEQTNETAEVWIRALGNVANADLDEAITLHLRSPKGKWWPKPAELLSLLPRRTATPEPVEQGWLGQALASVTDGRRRVDLMAQAFDVVHASPACGQTECRTTCRPCTEAMLRVGDDLARAAVAA